MGVRCLEIRILGVLLGVSDPDLVMVALLGTLYDRLLENPGSYDLLPLSLDTQTLSHQVR